MTDPPDISVIVVSHAHEDMLPACMDSLGPALEGLSAEIILIDNLQAGGVRRALAGRDLIIRENAAPLGFAANVNAGTRAASGRCLLILNPDTEHRFGRLSEAIRFLDAHPEIGLLGCTLRDEHGAYQQSFRRFPSFAFLLVRGLGGDRWPWRPAFYRERLMENIRHREPHPVDWVFGAFMLVRRTDFARLGGMDERFRLYYEDVDLCRRFRAAGLATYVYGELEFTHRHQRLSARRPFSRSWRWHVMSALRYFWKAAATPLSSQRPRPGSGDGHGCPERRAHEPRRED